MTVAHDELARYVPSLSVRAALADAGETVACRRTVWGSCLWLDVSGFSAHSDRLAKRGPAGIALLSEMLGEFYEGIASVVSTLGGDVVFFAGDGALCYWYARDERELGTSATDAAKAALRLGAELGARRFADEQLEFRIGVSSGSFELDTAGGDAGSWLDLLTGPSLTAAASLSGRAPVGRVLVTPRSARLLGPPAELELIEDDALLLLGLNDPPDSERAPETMPASGLSPRKLSERAPAFVVQQPDAAQPRAAELRRVSVAFSHWEHALTGDFESLSRAVVTLQRLAREHGGTLCQLVEDDKGVEGFVVFGLPGKAHGEDALRAVRFAAQLSEELDGAVRPRVGVATGSAYCGACGDRRRQYCVIGLSVIRAARLAQLATEAPLVDEATYEQSVRRFDFGPARLLTLKGLGPAARAHRLKGPRTDPRAPERFIGRRREQQLIDQTLVAFAGGTPFGLLLIEGELGLGKTALLSQVVASCRSLGLECESGVADELEQHASFFAVRGVMRSLLGSEDAQRAALTSLGESELLALLNPLTGSNFAESPLSAGMAPETRAENRRRIAEKLLEQRLHGRRTVALLDDAHWIDASSCELVRYLSQRLPALSWIVAGRPGRTEADSLASRFGRAPALVLGALEPAEVAELVGACQGGPPASLELGASIHRLARGNPLHTLEVVRSLVGSRRLTHRGGVLELEPGTSSELEEVPATLEELIQSRFDRLPSPTRTVLRAASVIGASFDVRVLFSVLAREMRAAEVESALGAALLEGLVQARGLHEFEHASIRAVIYGLLLPREQRLLHERVAETLHELHRGSERAIAARLAQHWLRARVPDKAAEFSGMAAAQALEAYANADAVHLFTQALEQDHAHRGALGLDVKRANWASGLGQALYSQSRHREARAAYRRALGWSEPSLIQSGATLPLSIARYLLRVVLPEKLGVVAPTAAPEVQKHYVAAMRASAACGALDVWEGRLLEAASRSFTARVLAQRAVDSPESAEIVAGLGYLLGATPARARAEHELRAAIGISDALGDLQSRVTTRVFYGMFLTMVGRTHAAEAPLLVAQEAAERLGSGLWRHRASFGLGEALFFEAKLESAADAFSRAAAIASDAEPPVEGFANSLAALARARLGHLEAALSLVMGPRGFTLTQRDGLILQRFTSLGVAAELLLRAGRTREALELAERAFALCESDPRADVFFAGIHGYAGIAAVFLRALASGSTSTPAATLRRRLSVTLRRLRAFARMYPAGSPCVAIFDARSDLARGATRKARAGFARARRAAVALDQPYFELVAQRWRAEVERGERRAEALRRADALSARFGLRFSDDAGG